MKIVIKDVEIHLLPADHMLIIFEPNGIIFKCTVCAGTKDIYYLSTINSEHPLPFEWMKTCTCNAPRSGGVTQPLDQALYNAANMTTNSPLWSPPIAENITSNVPVFHPRLVERDS